MTHFLASSPDSVSKNRLFFGLVVYLSLSIAASQHLSLQNAPSNLRVSRNSDGIVRNKWCDWSSWSRCSTANCVSGIGRRSSNINWAVQNGQTRTPPIYCLERKKSGDKAEAVLAKRVSGATFELRQPMKQRNRTCICYSRSLLNLIKNIIPQPCHDYQVEFQCKECGYKEPIYAELTGTHDDESPLSECASIEEDGHRLHKILGGVGAIVAGIALTLCTIRIIAGHLSRRARQTNDPRGHRTGERSGRAPHGQEGRRQTSAPCIDVSRHVTVEAPPEYKDVDCYTSLSDYRTEMLFTGGNGKRPGLPSNPAAVDDAPPPSYCETVAALRTGQLRLASDNSQLQPLTGVEEMVEEALPDPHPSEATVTRMPFIEACGNPSA